MSPSHPDHVRLADRHGSRREEFESQQRMQHQRDLTREQLAESRRQQMHVQQEMERLSSSQQVCDKLDINDPKYNSTPQIRKLQKQ